MAFRAEIQGSAVGMQKGIILVVLGVDGRRHGLRLAPATIRQAVYKINVAAVAAVIAIARVIHALAAARKVYHGIFFFLFVGTGLKVLRLHKQLPADVFDIVAAEIVSLVELFFADHHQVG